MRLVLKYNNEERSHYPGALKAAGIVSSSRGYENLPFWGRLFIYQVIVKGIETEEQREIIKKIDGKLYYQGFLVSKAVPIDLFKESFLQIKEENPVF